MRPIGIIVAEDATLVRRLLVQHLSSEKDFEVLGEATNGREAVELAAAAHPDVVVMDLEMPLLNGMEATERIRALHPETRIVILTAHDTLTTIGTFSGASECLGKCCTPQELAAAVRRVFRDGSAVPAGGAKFAGKEQVERLAVRARLTERERLVLQRVLSDELTNHQIARSLAQELDQPVSEAAVKHTLRRILHKLNVEPHTRAALIKRVMELIPAS